MIIISASTKFPDFCKCKSISIILTKIFRFIEQNLYVMLGMDEHGHEDDYIRKLICTPSSTSDTRISSS